MNNNEEKNNNQGIFYAVIGVATLVVTIVGATFAFFSATTNSPVNAVSTNSATVSLGFTPDATGIKDALIPINEALPRFPSVVGTSLSNCKDDNSNNICSVYQFTISNPSTTASQRIYVTLTPNVNEFSNLHYAVFKGNDTQIKATTAKYDVAGTAVTTYYADNNGTAASSQTDQANATPHIIGKNGDLVISNTAFGANSTTVVTLSPLEQVLAPNSSVTYTIVLWIHETTNDQTSVDSGKNFAATINVTTAGGGSGVTGVLAVQGN